MFGILKQLKKYIKDKKRIRVEKKYREDIDYMKSNNESDNHYAVLFYSVWKPWKSTFKYYSNLAQINKMVKSRKKTDYLKIQFIFDLEENKIIYYKDKWMN